MNIWILDDDVSFSYELKDELQALKNVDHRLKKLSIEVFHKPSAFLEYVLKHKKDKAKQPQLVFFDVQMPEKSGLQLYLDLLHEHNPLIEVIHFCSSIGFGSFESFFEARRLTLPPFVQKSRVKQELANRIEPYIPKDEIKPLSFTNIPTFKLNQILKELEATLKQLKAMYYDNGLKNENRGELQINLVNMKAIAQNFKNVAMVSALQKIDELFQQKVPSMIKVKHELKIIFDHGDELLEALKVKNSYH